jgi:hypothetical protein
LRAQTDLWVGASACRMGHGRRSDATPSHGAAVRVGLCLRGHGNHARTRMMIMTPSRIIIIMIECQFILMREGGADQHADARTSTGAGPRRCGFRHGDQAGRIPARRPACPDRPRLFNKCWEGLRKQSSTTLTDHGIVHGHCPQDGILLQQWASSAAASNRKASAHHQKK